MDRKITQGVTGIRWWVWVMCAGFLAIGLALVWQTLSTPDGGARDPVLEGLCRKPAGSRANGDLIYEYTLEEMCQKFLKRPQKN